MRRPLWTDAWRRTAVLVTLTAALCAAGAALWRQQQNQIAHGAAHTAGRRVFDFGDPNAVTEVVLTHGTKERYVLVRDANETTRWSISSHRDILAEASGIEALLHAALTLQADRTVLPDTAGGASADLYAFGLAPPAHSLTLSGWQPQSPALHAQTLHIGKTNSFSNTLYVQREGEAEIAVVPASFLYPMTRDLYQLRDKRAAVFATDAVQQITVAPTPYEAGYTVVRSGDGYRLTSPRAVAADRGEVDGLLTALATLRGRQVVAEDADAVPLSPFGLQRPRFDVTLQLQDTSLVRLLFGEVQLRGASHIFVRQAARHTPVWELDSDWPMQRLRQGGGALRDMRLLHVAAADVARLTVHHGKTTQTWLRQGLSGDLSTKTRADGAATWVLAPPRDGGVQGAQQASSDTQPAARLISAAQIETMVLRLTHLKAARIAAEQATPEQLRHAHLHRPRLEVDLLDAGEHLLGSLLIGDAVADGALAVTDAKTRLDVLAQGDLDDILAPFATTLSGPDGP
jgi:hypothetical protein